MRTADRKRKPRPWWRAPQLWFTTGAVLLALAALRFGGRYFHPCDMLDRRVCSELGPDRCAVYMQSFRASAAGSHRFHIKHVVNEAFFHGLLGWDTDRSHGDCSTLNMPGAFDGFVNTMKTATAQAAAADRGATSSSP